MDFLWQMEDKAIAEFMLKVKGNICKVLKKVTNGDGSMEAAKLQVSLNKNLLSSIGFRAKLSGQWELEKV